MKQDENIPLLKFKESLKRKNYRESTIRVYVSSLRYFFGECKACNVSKKDYPASVKLLHDIACRGLLTHSSIYRIKRTLKLFNEAGFSSGEDSSVMHFAKQNNETPCIFTREEVMKILCASSDCRQKALLTLAYACGLRLSEISSLKIQDADIHSKVLRIRGNTKERFVMLPEKIIGILDEYKKIYRPCIWLFESASGEKYSGRSIELLFRKAINGSGISKRCSFRNLRHSFASHMIESGTDIYLLQRIMGHNSVRSTRGYLRISGIDISKVKSPIEDIRI